MISYYKSAVSVDNEPCSLIIYHLSNIDSFKLNLKKINK